MRGGHLAMMVVMAIVARPAAGAEPAATWVRQGPGVPLPAGAARAVEQVRAEALAAHVWFLASPALAGRGLGEPGLEAAAEYVASVLELQGIAPLPVEGRAATRADYFQAVPLRELFAAGVEVTTEVRVGDAVVRRVFAAGDCSADPRPAGGLDAAVVDAGYGLREPALAHDDLAGLDVRGRIALIRGGLPDGPAWQTDEMRARHLPDDPDERYGERLDALRELGAAAVLVAEPDWAGRDGEERDGRAFQPLDGDRGAPLVRVSTAVAASLLDGSARGLLPGARVSLRFTAAERVLASRNVLAWVPGADPAATGAVMLGAHLDHLGAPGGVVHPGADDDASGVAALLEIARALAASPPRRPVVLAFWTGEEEGRLGSGCWAQHPRWPLARTVAYLNLDMIGYPWSAEEVRRTVAADAAPDPEAFTTGLDPADLVELGLPPGRVDLEEAARRAAGALGLALRLEWTAGLHGGSDYRAFARAGVPFLRFFDVFHAAYHRPTDTAEALDVQQVRKVARLALAAAWLLADRSH